MKTDTPDRNHPTVVPTICLVWAVWVGTSASRTPNTCIIASLCNALCMRGWFRCSSEFRSQCFETQCSTNPGNAMWNINVKCACYRCIWNTGTSNIKFGHLISSSTSRLYTWQKMWPSDWLIQNCFNFREKKNQNECFKIASFINQSKCTCILYTTQKVMGSCQYLALNTKIKANSETAQNI